MNMRDFLASAIQQAQANDSSAPAPVVVQQPQAVNVLAAEVANDDIVLAPTLTIVEQPKVVKPKVAIKKLDEKGVLFRLRRQMYDPNPTDEEATEKYVDGVAKKALFKGTNNRVKAVTQTMTKVYSTFTGNSVPWLDNGWRIVNLDKVNYIQFTGMFRALQSELADRVQDLVDNWDYEVQQDITRRIARGSVKGVQVNASVSDYPTADEIGRAYKFDLTPMPVPSSGDFRVDIPDAEMERVEGLINEAQAKAAAHVLTEMITPLVAAADKLSVPIGEQGSIFRDSLVENLVDVATRMDKVNLSDDPAIQEVINDMKGLANNCSIAREALRSSQLARTEAVNRITALTKRLKEML